MVWIVLDDCEGNAMTVLSSCPFCGGEARLVNGLQYDYSGTREWFSQVSCCSCNASGTKFFDFNHPSIQERRLLAVSSWNTRIFNDRL